MELDTKYLEEQEKTTLSESVQKEEQQEEPQNNVNSAELVQYVNFFHNLVFNKFLNMEVKPELLEELNRSGSELLAKYMPKADVLGKYSAEIAYITVISVIVMQDKQTKKLEFKGGDDTNDTN